VPKHQTWVPGLDGKILVLYALGISVRDVQRHMEDLYQVEVSPALISEVTDSVWGVVQEWQNWPVEKLSAIVYLDALMVEMRVDGRVEPRAIHITLEVTMDGQKYILGIWLSANDGAKVCPQVLKELKNGGVRDVLIFCVDGMKGFPEAIQSAYSKKRVQLCVVHIVRGSLEYLNYKEQKTVAAGLRRNYSAPTAGQGLAELAIVEEEWGKTYPTIWRKWRQNRKQVATLYEFPEALQRVMYTTDAIKATSWSIRKVIKTKGAFPSEYATRKLIYPALEETRRRWRHISGSKDAMNYLAIAFQDCGRPALSRERVQQDGIGRQASLASGGL
jgi:putative transposase